MANIPDDREPDDKRSEYGDHDLVPDAQAEVKAMLKEGLDHPSTKPVLTGAAIGAAAGWILPIVGPIIGGVAGAGFMLYKRLRP